MKNRLKKRAKRLPAILLIFCGVLFLIYPWISNYLFENRTDGKIETYTKEMEDTKEDEKEEWLSVAEMYNRNIYESPIKLTDPFTVNQIEEQIGTSYESILQTNEEGMMGMIEIPKISVKLPIYHGTSEGVLEKGIGHLQGTSFPIGGESTHAVLTGHTGLNSAKMFTDLIELEKDDYFFITVLGHKLAYQVKEIQVVLPDEVDCLYITKGKDLVTLITCTPYGVNDHRLFVTGERTEYTETVYEEESQKESGDSMWMRSYAKAVLIGLVLTPFVLLTVILYERKISRIIKRKIK